MCSKNCKRQRSWSVVFHRPKLRRKGMNFVHTLKPKHGHGDTLFRTTDTYPGAPKMIWFPPPKMTIATPLTIAELSLKWLKCPHSLPSIGVGRPTTVGLPSPTSTISSLGVYVEQQQLVVITFDLWIKRERDKMSPLRFTNWQYQYLPVIMIHMIFTLKTTTKGIKRKKF